MKAALVGHQKEKVGERQSEEDQAHQQMRTVAILLKINGR